MTAAGIANFLGNQATRFTGDRLLSQLHEQSAWSLADDEVALVLFGQEAGTPPFLPRRRSGRHQGELGIEDRVEKQTGVIGRDKGDIPAWLASRFSGSSIAQCSCDWFTLGDRMRAIG